MIEEQQVTPGQPPPAPSTVKSQRFSDPQDGLFARDQAYGRLFNSSSSSPLPLQSPKPACQSQSFTQLLLTLHVAESQVQISADLSQGSQGLVCLCFQDLKVQFTKDHPHSLAVQLALQSLLMEDLLVQNPKSKYRNLMVSRGTPKPSTFSQKEYLSQSCPSASNVLLPDMPRSLPAHMEEAHNVFQLYQRLPGTPSASIQKSKRDPDCPCTPPPSPIHRPASPQQSPDFDTSLVHINLLLVDQRHPEYKTRYGGIERSVDIDFNCLDILITLQTWVVILDFFDIGSSASNHAVNAQSCSPKSTAANPLHEPEVNEEETTHGVNAKVDLKVNHHTCCLKLKLLCCLKKNLSLNNLYILLTAKMIKYLTL